MGYQSTREACDVLGVAPYTLRKLARAGKVPAVKVGHVWRFDVAGITAAAKAAGRTGKDD